MEDVRESNVDMLQLKNVRNVLSCKSRINLQDSSEPMLTQITTCNESKTQSCKIPIRIRGIMLAIIVAFLEAFAVTLSIHSYTSIK